MRGTVLFPPSPPGGANGAEHNPAIQQQQQQQQKKKTELRENWSSFASEMFYLNDKKTR